MNTHTETRPTTALSTVLAEQELTHLELVLRRALSCGLGGPLLSPSYWRERIATVTRQVHLTPTQIQTVHRLYLTIDLFELDVQRKKATALSAQLSADA
jgi:hypothetical protein